VTREKRTAIGAAIALAVCVIYRLLPLSWPEDAALRYGRMCVEEVLLLGVPAVMLRPWRSSRIKAEKRWWVYGSFLLAALALHPAMRWISEIWAGLFPSPSAVYPVPVNALESLLMVCALVLVPAVCEEAFFRGAMYCGLVKRLGFGGTFWLVSAVFALIHFQPGRLPFHLAAGLMLTLAMRRTGRIGLPVAMHAVINGMGLMNL